MELLIIVLLVMLNGVLAMSEAAVISSRKARLQQKADDGKPGAKAALELAEDPNRFLSTVQIGITLVGVLAGAFGGAALADDLTAVLIEFGLPRGTASTLALALIVAFTSYLSLIIGELVPKRLAIQNPESIAALIARPMQAVSRWTAPLVWFLSASTDAVLWVMRVRQSDEPPVTEEEIRVMLAQGRSAGVIEQGEESMIAGVFRLNDLRAESIMTPRIRTAWIDVNGTSDDLHEVITDYAHSHYLACEDEIDHVIGVLPAREMLRALLAGESLNLRALALPPIYVPESASADALLERFRGQQSPLAVVIGEHGGVEGVVTLYDILEALVGDVEMEGAVQRDDGSWLMDGLLPREEFMELLGMRDDDEDEARYSTLAGFVMMRLNRVAQVTDQITCEGWTFEVVDMDGHRIDKVLVSRVREETPATDEKP